MNDLAEVEIRRAEAHDLADLVRLEEICFEDPWSETAVLDELHQPIALAFILRSQQVIGYAFFRLLLDEAELLRLAIHPDQRRQGQASWFLRQTLSQLSEQGVARCWLEVRADNTPALALYRGCRFEIQGRRAAYYRDGCDALLLECLLQARGH